MLCTSAVTPDLLLVLAALPLTSSMTAAPLLLLERVLQSLVQPATAEHTPSEPADQVSLLCLLTCS